MAVPPLKKLEQSKAMGKQTRQCRVEETLVPQAGRAAEGGKAFLPLLRGSAVILRGL